MPVTYSNLSGIPRFQSGVGGGDDLLVRVRENLEGEWYPVVHQGYYYVGTEEGYLYALKGTHNFSVSTTGQVVTITVTGLDEDPTERGPIRVVRDSDSLAFQRVCSPLRAFRPLSFSGSGELKSAALSGLLVSLISDPLSGIYQSTPTTGDIVSNEEYVWDRSTDRIYLRDNSPPSLWVTYLIPETGEDPLRLEEIHRVDLDGVVRVQYTGVVNPTGLTPEVTRPSSGGGYTVTATPASGNCLVFSSSGITSGDLVAARYYLGNSFSATYSGGTLTIRYLATTSGDHHVEYETGDTWYDTSWLADGHADKIQLSPVFTPRQSGFLYLQDSSEGYPRARKVRLYISNVNPTLQGSSGANQRLVARVLDGEDHPVPGVAVATSASGATGTLTLISDAEESDGRGEVVYTWDPSASGSVTFTVVVNISGDVFQDSLSISVRDVNTYLTGTSYELGKLLMHLEDSPFQPGSDRRRLSVYYCTVDGAPWQGEGTHSPVGYNVTLWSNQSQFYTLAGQPLHNRVTILTNEDGIASILVDPVPGDVIRAELQTEVSGRTRMARPIQLVEGDSDGG